MTTEMKYLEQTERGLLLQLDAIRDRKAALAIEAERKQEMEGVPDMISLEECRKRTGLSRPFLKGLCSSGEVPSVMVGNKCLVNYTALEGFLKRPKVKNRESEAER